jgi:hypothetical protein
MLPTCSHHKRRTHTLQQLPGAGARLRRLLRDAGIANCPHAAISATGTGPAAEPWPPGASARGDVESHRRGSIPGHLMMTAW